jgi:hypothetical protein
VGGGCGGVVGECGVSGGGECGVSGGGDCGGGGGLIVVVLKVV